MKTRKYPNNMTLAAPVTITAASADGDAPAKLPSFAMRAYTGAAIRLGGWGDPVVIDLDGVRFASQSLSIRRNHSPNRVVGHTTRVAVVDGSVVAEGVISFSTADAAEIVDSARQGFPWQASIGASADRVEYVDAGAQVTVNGRQMSGPLDVVRQATLREISFVDLGADGATSAKFAASASGENMDEKVEAGGAVEPNLGATTSKDNGPDTIVADAKIERTRRDRIGEMVKAATEEPGADLEGIGQIASRAITSRWTVQETELALLRAGRGRTPGIIVKDDKPTQKTLEASLLMAMGHSADKLAKDRDYGERVIEASWKNRRITLKQVFADALASIGVRASYDGEEMWRDVVRNRSQLSASGTFSTVNLPGLVGNVANKILLDSYTAVPTVFERIAQQVDFANFHTHTMYRLDHNGAMQRVGKDGKIPHGNLSESTFTNKLETSGQMLTLSRQDIINDNMNAFSQLFTTLGRKAKTAVEEELLNQVMEASDVFFSSAHGNRLTSAGLSITSLGTAEASMALQTDVDGRPIFAPPKILLVPPGLKPTADQLYTSTNVSADATSTGAMRPTDNPYKGRFSVETSPYLALAMMTGYSVTDWYLLADPAIAPAFQVAYLNGKRQPTVETADAEFDTLGMQMRCIFDFGTAQVDYRFAVKASA